jgi:hypothetical protein
MTTTTAAVGFRWLDLLEKEFDKSYVAIDHSSRSVAEDYELDEMYDTHRRLLANLGNCFVQLVHKAQTIFQVNAKLEAELINLREDLSTSQKSLVKTETEKTHLLCLLQSCLFENSMLKSPDSSKEDIDKVSEKIQLKLASDMAAIQRIDWNSSGVKEKNTALEEDNMMLRQNQAELESELVGARLDAKYLDKELAGRIQQIQILLASNASQEHKQQVWAQIEAEMHLQRSKTIANMCYSKQKLRDQQAKNSAVAGASPAKSLAAETTTSSDQQQTEANGHVANTEAPPAKPKDTESLKKNRLKQVHLHKHDADELGMAILGGIEHGLPIMISEIFPNSAVGRCKKIFAGDVILGVNGDSFTEMGHHDAVKYLSALRGSIRFDLENTIEADIDEVCDLDLRFSRLYTTEDQQRPHGVDKAPPQRLSLSHPGKAKDVRKGSATSSSSTMSPSKESSASNMKPREVPQVHSPTKFKSSSSSSGQSN